MTIVYLASPYTHAHPAVREYRFEQAAKASAKLMRDGVMVYSPIVHGHPMSVADPDMPTDFDFWMTHCFAMLAVSVKMIILQLDGWEISRGVLEEIRFAEANGMDIEFMEWPCI